MPYFLADIIGDGSDTEGNQRRAAVDDYGVAWSALVELVHLDVPKMLVRCEASPLFEDDPRITLLTADAGLVESLTVPFDGETDLDALALKIVRAALVAQRLAGLKIPGPPDLPRQLDQVLTGPQIDAMTARLSQRGPDPGDLVRTMRVRDLLSALIPHVKARIHSGQPSPSGTFTDDFNGAGSNTALHLWTPSGGTAWTQVDGTAGKVVVSPAGYTFDGQQSGDAAYRCDDQASADQYSQATTKGSGGASFGIVNRLTDRNNFLGVQVPTGGNARLFKRVSGSFTQLSSTGSTTLATDDLLRFESDGDAHEVFLNGTSEIGPVNDSFNNTETRQGVVARAASSVALIDNFEAGVLGGGGTDALTASDVTTPAAVVGAPAIGQTHALAAAGVTTGAPVVGAPALGQTHALSASDVTTGAPVVDAPAIGDTTHNLIAADVATGAPVVDAPTLGQTHALAAAGVTTGAPVVGAPALNPPENERGRITLSATSANGATLSATSVTNITLGADDV